MLRALEAMRSATTDPLTGLGNRRRFEDRLEGELRRGRRLSVCLLDLDGLKQLNDTFGHQEGDRALRAVAERLEPGGALIVVTTALTDAPFSRHFDLLLRAQAGEMELPAMSMLTDQLREAGLAPGKARRITPGEPVTVVVATKA